MDELVCREWTISGTNMVYHQAIVPLNQRRLVLKYCHDDRSSGHLVVKKTLGKMRQKYYWHGLQNDVRLYIAGCDACCTRKRPLKKKQAPMQIVKSGIPVERLAIDILGELPETEEGNRYILVVSDYLSKWTEVFPMRNMEAETVTRIVVEEVICRFGVPNYIHSDQGKQFESRIFQEMCRLLGITKTRTTAYHIQSDGMIERFNGSVIISAYVSENHKGLG